MLAREGACVPAAGPPDSTYPPLVQRLGTCLLALLLVGCSSDPSTPATTAGASASPPPVTPVVEPVPLHLQLVAAGLEFPSAIVGGPDGTFYVTESRSGLIRVIEADGSVRSEPFLDLSDRVLTGGERGLLGLALHPDYESNGRLFVHYTRAPDGAVIVSEFARAGDRDSAELGSEQMLLTVDHPSDSHNGGQLEFGPDGYLYIGLGDGADTALGHGQNARTLLGKVLRIDVDGEPSDGRAYVIPEDNPFVAGGGAAEVYLLGLRNPWRFSFDDATDAL